MVWQQHTLHCMTTLHVSSSPHQGSGSEEANGQTDCFRFDLPSYHPAPLFLLLHVYNVCVYTHIFFLCEWGCVWRSQRPSPVSFLIVHLKMKSPCFLSCMLGKGAGLHISWESPIFTPYLPIGVPGLQMLSLYIQVLLSCGFWRLNLSSSQLSNRHISALSHLPRLHFSYLCFMCSLYILWVVSSCVILLLFCVMGDRTENKDFCMY